MQPGEKVYVAGHRGLVGAAIVRRLERKGLHNLVLRTSKELDLREQEQVRDFFETEKPCYVFLAAAKVGGILANETYPADFIRDNLLVQTNVIDAAYKSGAKKLLFLGSSCIYPKYAPQPMKEEHLLTGPLEPTNEWYAIAKIAGLKMCAAYRRQYNFNAISVMPTNLYGIGDNFNLENSHVIPALIRKFHDAKVSGSDTVMVWGSGTPRREFLYVDDLADACLYLMQHYDEEELVNIGTGKDLTIAELAVLIKEVVGFQGQIRYDSSKKDGPPQKLLDVSRLERTGWKARTGLREGLQKLYAWYISSLAADGVRA